MKVKIKKVYYCEHCKKHSLSASVLSVHEKHCLKNIDRECRLCKIAEKISLTKENKLEIIEKIQSKISILKSDEEKQSLKLDDIEKILNEYQRYENCPNCLMSILLLTGIMKYPYTVNYDYKKELMEWWKDFNNADYDDTFSC